MQHNPHSDRSSGSILLSCLVVGLACFLGGMMISRCRNCQGRPQCGNEACVCLNCPGFSCPCGCNSPDGKPGPPPGP